MSTAPYFGTLQSVMIAFPELQPPVTFIESYPIRPLFTIGDTDPCKGWGQRRAGEALWRSSLSNNSLREPSTSSAAQLHPSESNLREGFEVGTHCTNLAVSFHLPSGVAGSEHASTIATTCCDKPGKPGQAHLGSQHHNCQPPNSHPEIQSTERFNQFVRPTNL